MNEFSNQDYIPLEYNLKESLETSTRNIQRAGARHYYSRDPSKEKISPRKERFSSPPKEKEIVSFIKDVSGNFKSRTLTNKDSENIGFTGKRPFTGQLKYKICPNLIEFGHCKVAFCKYAHSYSELRIKNCNHNYNCNYTGCRFLHPNETIEEYCQRTRQKILETETYSKKRRYSPDSAFINSPERYYRFSNRGATVEKESKEDINIISSREMASSLFEAALRNGAKNIVFRIV